MSHGWVVPLPAPPSLAVDGTHQRFPIHRIYCVGRNFADHAREMGAPAERGDAPVLFQKPADAVVADGGRVPYPPATRELHHEVELVLAVGRDADGVVAAGSAHALLFGYGVGLDLTRRDLQAQAKAKGLPWDLAKGFDHSAPIGALRACAAHGMPHGELWLEVNGEPRQRARLADMLWSGAEVIHELSKLFRLRAGDLVFMGTPAGVAALQPGGRFRAGLDAWSALTGEIVA